MANVFDQFDEENVFDQFDDPAPVNEGFHQFNDPRGAVVTLASGIVGLPVSGLAGLGGMATGFIGGLAPGGESPLEKGQRFGAEAQAATQDFLTIDPPNQASEDVLMALGKATNAVASIPFGHLPDEPTFASEVTNRQQEIDFEKQGIERQRRVIDEGAGPVFGSMVLDATNSPFLATLAEVVPTAVGSVAAIMFGRPPTPKPPSRPTVTQGAPSVSVGKPTMDAPVDLTPPSADSLVTSLRKGKTKAIADAVVPDAQVIESAQRLGIDLNPEHYSTSSAFQDVTRALKQQPGSSLQSAEVLALTELSKAADDLILKNKGHLDKSEFNQTIATEIDTTILEMKTKSNAAYNQVTEAIPPATRIDVTPVSDFLDQKLAELGGDKSLLTAVEKKLLSLTRRTTDGEIIPPTYAALDRVRKDVGNGFSRQGPYADVDSAILAEVYGVLSDTQGGAARSFGVGDLYDSARELVAKRKGIEDTAVQLFGRNLSNSLVPKLKSAATGLVQGDMTKFEQLIRALPESRRAEAAATVVGEIFSGGGRRGGELSTGFVASFRALNRNQTAKNALFAHLPKGARQRFDDIGRVITGIVESNRKTLGNPSGTAGGILKALDDISFVEKVYQGGKTIAKSEAASSTFGFTGLGSAYAVGSLISGKRTPISVTADKMLASPAFARAVKESAEGKPKEANRIIEGSPVYKAWLSNISPEVKSQIAAVGFISWLAAEEQ